MKKLDWKTPEVLVEILKERRRQEDKWGEQNHPDGTDISFETEANSYRQLCDEQHEAGTVTWTDILLEEVFEALAETDKTKLREELIQVAAVATAWVENIDRDLEKKNE